MGRKGTLFLGAIIFTIGGAVQTFTTGFSVMVLGRIISGFGVGLLSYVCLRAIVWDEYRLLWRHSTIVPIYQSEISPPNHVRLHQTLFSVLAERDTTLLREERSLVRNLLEMWADTRSRWYVAWLCDYSPLV